MTSDAEFARELAEEAGRILLQRKLVTSGELDELLAHQREFGGRLATSVAAALS